MSANRFALDKKLQEKETTFSYSMIVSYLAPTDRRRLGSTSHLLFQLRNENLVHQEKKEVIDNVLVGLHLGVRAISKRIENFNFETEFRAVGKDAKWFCEAPFSCCYSRNDIEAMAEDQRRLDSYHYANHVSGGCCFTAAACVVTGAFTGAIGGLSCYVASCLNFTSWTALATPITVGGLGAGAVAGGIGGGIVTVREHETLYKERQKVVATLPKLKERLPRLQNRISFLNEVQQKRLALKAPTEVVKESKEEKQVTLHFP